MKTSIIFAILFTIVGAAHAGYDEIGTIKNVQPIQSEQYQPTQVCDSQLAAAPQQQQQRGNKAGAIIGGIAGALLGNQVGGGNGRVAMTALGAVTGAMSGDRIDNGSMNVNAGYPVQQQTCRWVQTATMKVTGYLVTYEVQGRAFQATFPYDPSQNGSNANIRVTVSASPRF